MAKNNSTSPRKVHRISSPRDENNNSLMLPTIRYRGSVLHPNEPTMTLDDWQEMRRKEEEAKRRGPSRASKNTKSKPKRPVGPKVGIVGNENLGPQYD